VPLVEALAAATACRRGRRPGSIEEEGRRLGGAARVSGRERER
jgi:hypothetical protein